MRTRIWVCYALPSEESVADRVLAQCHVAHAKGKRERLNGVLQTGYTFKRKRDFKFMADGLGNWVHEDFMRHYQRP